MKRKAIAVIATPPRLSPLEEYERDYAGWEPYVTRQLNRAVERAAELRTAFVERATRGRPGDLSYAAAWGKETFKADYEAVVASAILTHYEKEPEEGSDLPRAKRARLRQAIGYYHEELTRKLVRDYLPANSTGEWHRAAEATERSAAATMVEHLGAMISWYAEIEERGRKLGS